LNVELGHCQLDGAALDEDGEEDDEEGGGEEDVLELVVLAQDCNQRESDGTSEAAVRQNKLFL
jgi:hypothetical protein